MITESKSLIGFVGKVVGAWPTLPVAAESPKDAAPASSPPGCSLPPPPRLPTPGLGLFWLTRVEHNGLPAGLNPSGCLCKDTNDHLRKHGFREPGGRELFGPFYNTGLSLGKAGNTAV